MRLLGWDVRRATPVTSPAQEAAPVEPVTDSARIAALEAWVTEYHPVLKETRSRLETVYRKVYRDLARDATQDTPPAAAFEPATPQISRGERRTGDAV